MSSPVFSLDHYFSVKDADQSLEFLRVDQDSDGKITEEEVKEVGFDSVIGKEISNFRGNPFLDSLLGLNAELGLILQIISLSASANKLSKIKDQAEEYAALIMEELDPENRGFVDVKLRSLTEIFHGRKPIRKPISDQSLIFNRFTVWRCYSFRVQLTRRVQ